MESEIKVYADGGLGSSFEGYAEWPQLEKLLTSHLSFRSEKQLDSAGEQPPPGKEAADVRILVPGCGNSKLSENLYDAGFKNITNSDYSEVVIRDTLKRNLRVRPEMKWRVRNEADMMQFENETFDAIVDKGGLDSLMEPTLGSNLGTLYLTEVKRVLKAGGKYVCLTLANRLVLDILFDMFLFGWKMSLYAIGLEASSRDSKLQTFMVVAEKDSSPAVYAISSFVEQNFFESNSKQAHDLSKALLREKKKRLEYNDGDDVIYSLKDLLLGAIGTLSKLVPGRRVNLSLGRPEGFVYNGVLLDAKEESGPFIYPYAVFLVPQNQAHEWLYTSEEGQWLIVVSSKASRLLMIFLDSSNSDLSKDYIQMDLSPLVMQLEPGDCDEGYQTPYLRAADKMSKQEIVYEEMGRKKKQQGETVPDGGQTSEKKQEELVEEKEDVSDKDKSDEVDTNERRLDSFKLYADWAQFEKLLTSHLSFRLEEQQYPAGEQPPQTEKEAADVSILVPLCINSNLSEHLYDAGFKNILCCVVSEIGMREMLQRNVRLRPEMKWRIMNRANMNFANETYDAIVDKGGLDSLMRPTLGLTVSSSYLSHVKKVLKAGGKYVCVTFARRPVLELLFRMFRFGWEMSLYAIGQEASSSDPKLPTFMVVAEKMNDPTVYSISSFVEQHFFDSNSNQARDLYEVLQRENKIRLEYADDTDMLYSLEDLQLGALGKISQHVPGRRVKLSIGRRYNGVLLDAKEDSEPIILPYAVFLVPHNRAHEWIYTSEEGQWGIVLRSKVSRLLVIFLDSSHSNLSMDRIQKDLSSLAEHLKPGDCGEGYKISYMTASANTKKRETVYEGSSVKTGQIVVEDETDYKGCTFRRLIFKRNDNLVQSQVLLSIKESDRISTDVGKDKEQQAPKPQNKGKQRKSDSQSSRSPVSSGEVKVVHDHLVSRYHIGIVFGIRLISSYLKVSTSAMSLVKTVVIGLGGGSLPMFMKNYLPSLKIEVVELDSKILQVAKEYFGFSNDQSLKVHIADGIKFVKGKAGKVADGNSSSKIDILIVDVHTSDVSSALTSPAADFLDESFLLTAKGVLSEQGLFIINVVSRSSLVKNEVYSKLKKVFSCILTLPTLEDINEVLFALKTNGSPIKEDQLSEACNEFAKSLKRRKKQIEKEVVLSKSIKLMN